MMRRVSLLFGLCLVLLVGLGLGVSAGARSPATPQSEFVFIPPGNPVEIAVATCDGWPTFQDSFDAVRMAMADHGPVKGFSLQRNDYSTLCDVDSGAAAADAIVAHEQNVGVIGPLYSSSTVGAAPVFESARLVMISYASTRPDLPTFGPNVFNRTIIPDPGGDAWVAAINALPSAVAWRAEFEAAYGRAPDPYAILAYDAAALLLARLEEVSFINDGGNLVINRAALAAAVRNTANWPGASGLVSLEVNGDRVNSNTTAVWADEFPGPSLSPRWSWLDEDPTHWSLTDNPGFLRLITQWENRNRLVQDFPPSSFEMRTRVLFSPSENFQIAGLYVYGDENNYLKLGRAYCSLDPPFCVGNGIYFDHIEGGGGVGSNYALPTAVTDEAYLRIVRSGSDFTGYVSTNGTEWTRVGTHAIGFTPAKIGVTASNQGQPVGEIPADFDFFVLENPAPAGPLVVNTTVDEDGACTAEFCTLRQAIRAANERPGPDTITFNIPPGDPGYDPGAGQWIIDLNGESLPVAGDDTVLDATTQPAPGRTVTGNGSACPEVYLVVNATGTLNGFNITAAGVEVTGLGIKNALAHGVRIAGSGAHNNVLTCNHILNNGQDGVRIEGGATGNVVGSDDGSQGNLISGNGSDGVEITGSGTSQNAIAGNRIGTNGTGTQPQANGDYGVRISNGATQNLIGLAKPLSGNLISGNSTGGVLLIGSDVTGNVVQYNHIGTNGPGTDKLPNVDGVVVSHASQNTIGPGNLISGNVKDGVRLETAASSNVIKGNYIGTDHSGNVMVSNERFGVLVDSESNNNTIGGDVAADGNLISGNGYQQDYAKRGGVGIQGGTGHNVLRNNKIGTSASGLAAIPNGLHGVLLTDYAQENSIGQGTVAQYANVIAWNLGDGIRVDGSGSERNTIGRNVIHDNVGLGINNENGGNQNIPPPELLEYLVGFDGQVHLKASTCPGCTVLVYSDNSGEGQYFEGQTAGDPTTGRFGWVGSPTGLGYTLTATDANGNTSEFSAARVVLELAVDDALPHIVVNKVPGDAVGPAGSTTVEYEATIMSYDPSLHDDLDLALYFSSAVLGTPTRVFTRTQDSDYDGVPVNWSNPSPGVYRVQGIDLRPTPFPGTWAQRVILRFAVPNGATPETLVTLGLVTAQARAVSGGVDWALVQILKRADEIIITNRTVLYREYQDPGDTPTSFLEDLYALAQGPPMNWSPTSVIYYVDTYLPSLAAWDNTQVNYGSEATANAAALQVDGLIEDWVQDSTTKQQAKCFWKSGPEPWTCVAGPVDYPHDLLIAGDDNVIPFYRLPDPTGNEGKFQQGGNAVLAALRTNNYYFTDNYYADLSYMPDDFGWKPGGVELATGRLIGVTPAFMSALMTAGQYGPDQKGPARAIVASGCDIDATNIAGFMTGYGYNVLNDSETPSTVDNGNWQKTDLMNLLQGDYQLLYHGNHAREDLWCTPPCNSLQTVTLQDLMSPAVTSRLQADHPILTSCGCRSGLSGAIAHSPTMATVIASSGASAVMASTAIGQYCYWPGGYMCGSEDFMSEFWYRAANHPYTLNMGEALALNKRTWDGHVTVDDDEEKVGGIFELYGIPWITAPYRGAAPRSEVKAIELGAASARPTTPVRVAEQTYVVEVTFDASEYQVTHQDGFDLVEVQGMPLAHDTDVPVAPLAEAELALPFDGAVMGIEVVKADPLSLGTLNIPMVVPGQSIPGGDRGGPREVPPDAGVFPPQPGSSRSAGVEGYRLGRVYATPLTYDPATDQATLYQSLTVRVTYVLSSTIAALSLEADPADPAPGQPFLVQAQVINASAEPVQVTGMLTLESSLGQSTLQGRQTPSIVLDIEPFVVPAGATYALEVPWVAPAAEGPYSLLLELWQGGRQQVMTTSRLTVSGGWIAGLSVPDKLRPGQAAAVAVTFANRRAEGFSGLAAFSIYTADGLPVAELEPVPLAAEPGQEGTAGTVWATAGMPAGQYVVRVEVTDDQGVVSYGVAQRSFSLGQTVYLPWVRRNR